MASAIKSSLQQLKSSLRGAHFGGKIAPCSPSVRNVLCFAAGVLRKQDLRQRETWRPLVAPPDIPQHFRPLAGVPVFLLWENINSILPQREKKECRPHHGDFHLGGSFGLLFRLVGYENPQFLQGTDAYPVPSLFLSPFFVCYATQNGITCGTTMAATRKQGVSKLNDLHNSQVLK